MSERGRINRALQSARRSLEEMKGTRNPNKQQAAWEDFLLHWKRSIELLRSFCKSNGMGSIRDRRYKERIESSILNYAWEARNAEEHDASGSADARQGSFVVNALDRNKPLHIKHLEIEMGQVTRLDMKNGVTCVEEGRLEMKPVMGPGGKRVVDPPQGVSAVEVCVAAMNFADEFYKEVF
jgi:hypothetical protein